MSTSAADNKVYINLDEIAELLPNQEWGAQNTLHAGETCSIHQELIGRFSDDILDAVAHNTKGADKRGLTGWRNLNYLITGNRGSGKTTFLRALCEALLREGASSRSGRTVAIQKLFICDPTTMPEKENFFVDILAAIRQMLTFSDGSLHHGNGRDSHYMNTPSASCKESLEALARGVRQLGEQAAQSGDADPLALLNTGLRNSTSSHELKRQFNKLIDQMADCYHKDAFLIAIDDADIKGARNLSIMEIIRTYLTHPRIIILFTGEKRLINESLRKQQFEQFGAHYHKADTRNAEVREDMMETMAAQYIKKVFPPTNYIQLTSLWELMQKGEKTYHLMITRKGQQENADSELPLGQYVEKVFLASLSTQKDDAAILVEGFLRLSIRSIVHCLSYWQTRNIHILMQADTTQAEGRKNIAQVLYDSFSRTFFSELFSKGFDKSIMEINSVDQCCRGLLLHCAYSNNRANSHHLACNNARFEQQESALLLAAKSVLTVRNLKEALTYLLYGPFTVRAFQQFCARQAGHTNSRDHYQTFINALSAENAGIPTSRAQHLSHLFLPTPQEGSSTGYSPAHEVILITQKASIDVLEKSLDSISNELHQSDKVSPELLNAALLAAASIKRAGRPEKSYYVSPYNFIAFMLECLNTADKRRDRKDKINDVTILLRSELSRLEYYKLPPLPAPTSNERKIPTTDSGSSSGYSKAIDTLAARIVDWSQKDNIPYTYDAMELGRCADAIYEHIDKFLSNIEESNSILSPEERMYSVAQWLRRISAVGSSLFPKIPAHAQGFPVLQHIDRAADAINGSIEAAMLQNQEESEFASRMKSHEADWVHVKQSIQHIRENISYAFSDDYERRRRLYMMDTPKIIDIDALSFRAMRRLHNLFVEYANFITQGNAIITRLESILSPPSEEKNSCPIPKTAFLSKNIAEKRKEMQAFTQAKDEFTTSICVKFKHILEQKAEEAFSLDSSKAVKQISELSPLDKKLLNMHSVLKTTQDMNDIMKHAQSLLGLYDEFSKYRYEQQKEENRFEDHKKAVVSDSSFQNLARVLILSEEDIEGIFTAAAGKDHQQTNTLKKEWKDSISNLEKTFKKCANIMKTCLKDDKDAFINKTNLRIDQTAHMSQTKRMSERTSIINDIEHFYSNLTQLHGISSPLVARTLGIQDIPAEHSSTDDFATEFGLHQLFGKARKELQELRERAEKLTSQL